MLFLYEGGVMEKNEWKLKLYYMHILVKTIKVKTEDITSNKIIEQRFPIRIWFKKHIFKTIVASVVLQPIKQLKLDENKKEWHLECVLYEGGSLC